MTTPLHDKLVRLIGLNGPLSIADYMHICMADPEHGYYKNQTPIGAGGDFITSPEISQMFGELIGIWCIKVWQDLGKPAPFCLAELGPGRGTLMADLLRAAKSEPTFMDAVQIVLIETSDKLKQQQRENLVEFKINWIEQIENLPQIPTLVIANEFLDVIPMHQFTKTDKGWHEVGIGVGENNNTLIRVALANTIEDDLLPPKAPQEPVGSVFELSPAREAITQTLAEQIFKFSGAALLIDYGHDQSGFGDTFQAVRKHETIDPFLNPGEDDLTSHVDFERLKSVTTQSGAHVSPISPQGDFLLHLGLLERAGVLGSTADEKMRENLTEQVNRLASPDQMGTLFKVMGFSSHQEPLPGFSALNSE